MKGMDGFMSDGTAVNMGDPNSMRDQGQTRNAVYTGQIHFNESKSASRLPYRTFLKRDGPANNTYYSFGGSKMIADEAGKDRYFNPVLRDGEYKPLHHETIIYRKD